MKLLESVEELKSWDTYRTYMKESLKLLDGEAPAYISKDKLEFDVEGKPWKGHAFLAGKKAIMSIKKFKKDGVIFREGFVTRKSKELQVSGFKIPKLIKESEKTFLKLKLGYKIVSTGAEGGGEAGGEKLTPERRKEMVSGLSKMETDIDKIMSALKSR